MNRNTPHLFADFRSRLQAKQRGEEDLLSHHLRLLQTEQCLQSPHKGARTALELKKGRRSSATAQSNKPFPQRAKADQPLLPGRNQAGAMCPVGFGGDSEQRGSPGRSIPAEPDFEVSEIQAAEDSVARVRKGEESGRETEQKRVLSAERDSEQKQRAECEGRHFVEMWH